MTGPAAAPLLPAPPPFNGHGEAGYPLALPMLPEGAMTHLSASSISTFLRCPEQFRRIYLLGERTPPSPAMLNGRAVHHAHEVNFLQKIATGADLPPEEVEEAYAEGMRRAVDEAGGEGELTWERDYRGGPGRVIDRWVPTVRAYHTTVSPLIRRPLAVETRFVVDLGAPISVVGYTDLECVEPACVHEDGSVPEDAPLLIVDHKVTGRADSKVTGDRRLQGSIYAAARRGSVVFHTHTPSGVDGPLDDRVRVEAGPGVNVTARTVVTRAYAAIASLYAAFGYEDPWPGALTHSWACGYCGWRDDCVYWSGAAR